MTQIPGSSGEGDDAPLHGFADCHTNILVKLKALDRLPALLEPAAEARRIAADTVRFFRSVVYAHHVDEERELFPSVIASARPGRESDEVRDMVTRLVNEHRSVEAAWESLEPQMRKVAQGQEHEMDTLMLEALVSTYRAHALYEERSFLPLAQTILGRNGDHMAALGLALHLRRTMPATMNRFRHRI